MNHKILKIYKAMLKLEDTIIDFRCIRPKTYEVSLLSPLEEWETHHILGNENPSVMTLEEDKDY